MASIRSPPQKELAWSHSVTSARQRDKHAEKALPPCPGRAGLLLSAPPWRAGSGHAPFITAQRAVSRRVDKVCWAEAKGGVYGGGLQAGTKLWALSFSASRSLPSCGALDTSPTRSQSECSIFSGKASWHALWAHAPGLSEHIKDTVLMPYRPQTTCLSLSSPYTDPKVATLVVYLGGDTYKTVTWGGKAGRKAELLSHQPRWAPRA